MINCQNCRHWRDQNLPAHLRAGNPRAHWGYCDRAESTDGKPDDPDTRAIALDHESYEAGLLTSPDFGCNQGETATGSTAIPPPTEPPVH